ncbi:MAG TPA: T9SS type A sorting domain-containing protein [Bacteroidetes bacterium]|nr:T9SS type A sorting domain-containing protein [Bacteroidota bacterium]
MAKPGAIREVRMNRDALCDGILALNDDFLNTQTNIFGVANVAPGAITRLGGNAPNYAPSTAQGFVTSTVGSAGRLSRTTAPGNTYLFPVGTLSSWRPVEITPTTGGVNVYSVQFVQSPPANMTLRAASLSTINPAWFHLIERQLPSGSPENIRIYHDFTPDNICDINNVSIAEWNNTLWDDLNPVVSMAPPGPFMSWTQKTGYPGAYPTPFVSNQFALAGRYLAPSISSCVFPVELLYLHAQPLESSILLNWETASESNNSGFEIQRSIDGLSFSAVGWVDGIGTSNSNTSYSFEDQDVAANQRYFYRLRQVDYDGGQSLSNIVEAILLSGIDYAMGGFFPNPSNGQTSLWLSLAEAGSFNLELYNALGQEVLRDFRELQAGYSVLNFNFSSLPKGAYFANLKVNGERLNKRLIIE